MPQWQYACHQMQNCATAEHQLLMMEVIVHAMSEHKSMLMPCPAKLHVLSRHDDTHAVLPWRLTCKLALPFLPPADGNLGALSGMALTDQPLSKSKRVSSDTTVPCSQSRSSSSSSDSEMPYASSAPPTPSKSLASMCQVCSHSHLVPARL